MESSVSWKVLTHEELNEVRLSGVKATDTLAFRGGAMIGTWYYGVFKSYIKQYEMFGEVFK